MPEKWGPCSVTCGQGFRKREVQCKIFLDFARTMARLPDGHCQGPKPSEVERCVLEPCSAHRYALTPETLFVPFSKIRECQQNCCGASGNRTPIAQSQELSSTHRANTRTAFRILKSMLFLVADISFFAGKMHINFK